MNDKSKELLTQVAIAGLVLFVVYKIIGNTFSAVGNVFSTSPGGFLGAGSQENQNTITLAQTELSKLISAGYKSSKSEVEWQTIANKIREDGYIKNPATFGTANDFKDMVYQMSRVQNHVDIYKLILAFGTHNRFLFGAPVTAELDLFTFVRDCLDSSYIATINSNWKRKGIKIVL
jgi:hypothetical protein